MTQLDFLTAMQRAKQAGGGEPLPDGPYPVTVIEATPTTSSTQKPMIRVKYQVEAGPQQGRKLFDQFVFSADNDNALSFFFQHMSFFGLDETFFAQNPQWEQVAATLMGRRVTVVVGVRMWDGAMRNEVKGYKPAGAALEAVPMVPPSIPAYGQPVMPGAPMDAAPPLAPPVASMTPPVAPPAMPAPAAPIVPPAAPLPTQPVPGGMMPPQPAPAPAPAPMPVAAPPIAPAPPVAPAPMPPAAPAVAPMPAAPVAPAPVAPPAAPQQFEVPQVAQQPAPAPMAPPQMPQVPMPQAPTPAPAYQPTPEEPV